MCSPELVKSLQLYLHVEGEAATALCAALRSEFSSQSDLDGVRQGLNTSWLISCGALAFVMHAGFAMLCAGALRSKNTMNILLQTVLDACGCALAFYICGFAFAYGEGKHPNKFIGDSLFTLSDYSSHFTGTATGRWTDWFFAYVFAATAATIPAGAVAERFNFDAYLGYTVFVSAFVYPVVVHWVWSRQGWLTYAAIPEGTPGRSHDDFLFGSGMIDFAGSAVVHMVGGLSGLMGCVLVGPRLGRFDMHGNPVDMPGHSAVLSVLGTVLLWFGWYGFNPGSILVIDNVAAATVAARAAVCTSLAGAAGGVALLIIAFWRHRAWDLMSLCNGVLVGFVSVTAGAHVLEPWAAILVAVVGAVIFEGCCALWLRLKIDDPLSASPMHGICGMWACLFVGLLAKKEYVEEAYGRAPYYGLFYGGGGALLACQVVGLLAIAAWTCGLMGAFFAIFKWRGVLRIPPEQEHQGLDASAHGGSAYNHYDAPATSKHSVNSAHPDLKGYHVGVVKVADNPVHVTVDQYTPMMGGSGRNGNLYKPFASTVAGPLPGVDEYERAMHKPQLANASTNNNTSSTPSVANVQVTPIMGPAAGAASSSAAPPAAASGPSEVTKAPPQQRALSTMSQRGLSTVSRRVNSAADDAFMAPGVKEEAGGEAAGPRSAKGTAAVVGQSGRRMSLSAERPAATPPPPQQPQQQGAAVSVQMAETSKQ